jgi:hypothetical protein
MIGRRRPKLEGWSQLTAQTQFRDLLKIHVAPSLRRHGLTGSGQDFSRLMGHDWAVLNVQRDRYSTADEVRFTINLGVACPYVLAEDDIASDNAPPEVLCQFRLRIGQVLVSRRDTWWSVRAGMSAVELEVLGSTLSRHLVDVAIPALERMADHEAILASTRGGSGFDKLAPFDMDVIGPILRSVGPPERFAAYLAAIDAVPTIPDTYALYFDFRRRPGKAGTAKAVERLASPNRDRRAEALRVLSAAGPNVDLLLAMRPSLGDPDPYVRDAAVGSLARLGDIASLDRMVSMIDDDPARRTACAAATAVSILAPRLTGEQRALGLAAMRRRHARAVGHDRPILALRIAVLETSG